MQIKVEKGFNVVYKLLCICGCVYQLQNVVLTYFSFETVTQNRFIDPVIVHFPSLHYCIRTLYDAMDRSYCKRKYGFDSLNKYGFENLTDHITVAEMLKYSPDIVIDGCRFRDQTGNEIIALETSEECYKYFRTKKYIFQQYTCYQLIGKDYKPISFRSIESSMRFERVVYDMRLKGPLASFRKIRFTITNGGYPYVSRVYSPAFYKAATERISAHIYCQNFTINTLGYPYDKFTCEKEDMEHFNCIDTCLNETYIKKLGRLPFTLFHDYPIQMNLVSPPMIRNQSISLLLNTIYETCKKSCPTFPCQYDYCITMGHANTGQDEIVNKTHVKEGSTIRVETTGQPNAFITYLPKLPLLDFIIYIMSSLGTWFGLVMISCYPGSAIKSWFTLISNVRRSKRIVHQKNLIREILRQRNEIDSMQIFLNRHRLRPISRRHRRFQSQLNILDELTLNTYYLNQKVSPPTFSILELILFTEKFFLLF